MGSIFAARFSLLAAFLLATACQGSGAARPSTPDTPRGCELSCNSGYDRCMDRFSGGGIGASGGGGSAAADPADVCPDQLKSCLKQCVRYGG